ncbi:hypothetical protein H3N56_10385 [Cetobacterium sp. 2A]|uniref:hypothetical protein n=1 Tax=Cetobacterium sp. 2A TaxID=2754723 RepID=UPI00163CB6B9|nr:hypothetical protein [Cetobacterium sp. 2A]MBC2855315.1 hypothetical protein [Cetobacterium sp. 2A]MBC2856807.1 hypothetical protein [Cetobacterium sp. 2A]MBC2856848.1 hypothetical protein [Cetobacterium sp. 2A]
MLRIRVGVRYKCKKCGAFLVEKNEAGYFISNKKANKISMNGSIYKIVCQCGIESKYEI